ncbi:MAG: DNA polymerase III subunit gamma/tau [Clostridia bacterium]|nr:DNA polymerase III subunit gamma/tau [Clostridia bacterium]
MHQALYRKWRPKSFSEVCGQDHITSVLRYEVAENRLSHAYLFCGSRGTGKTTCAKLLSKAVNCLDPHDGNPCGVCAACRAIDSGASTDVVEMDAASNNGVDYIRDIREAVVYTPADMKYRVYIVDEVHMLSSGAFNALLKTLEEPPSHVIFILATTELHKLPATIISRCQRFDFRRIPSSVIVDRLKEISLAENIAIDDDAAAIIAKQSRGGMRDAVSMLELCAGGRERVTAEALSESLGVSSRELVVELASAIADRNIGECFSVIGRAENSSVDISVFWQTLTEFYRDMIIIKSFPRGGGYLELTAQEEEECRRVAEGYTLERLIANARELDDCASRMQRNSSRRRICAEMSAVRMCDDSLDDSFASLTARISALEERVAGIKSAPVSAASETEKPAAKPAGVVHAPVSEPAPAAASAAAKPAEKAPAAPVQAPAEAKKAFTSLGAWPEVIDRISQKNKAVSSFLSGTTLMSDGYRYMIRVKNAFAMSMLEKPDTLALIAESLSSVVGGGITSGQIVIRTSDAPKKSGGDLLSEFN